MSDETTVARGRAMSFFRTRSGTSRAWQAKLPLAALGPVEEDPDREVVAEVFEAVGDAGRREEEIAGSERQALPFDHKGPRTLDDDVALVARVRRLRVRADRPVDLDLQAAVAEELAVSLAVR